MRVVPEPRQKRLEILVHVRVIGDVVHEGVVLRLFRQLAVAEQPRDLEEAGLLGELLDRVAPIAQDTLVAIDEGDRAPARGGVQERRIVAQ